jgi:hypothetical protein
VYGSPGIKHSFHHYATRSKQPIAGVQGWSRSLAFQHGDLLPQSQDLEGGITPTSNEGALLHKAGKDRFDEHEPIF